MTTLLHYAPAILAAFLASLVEFVEVLTIVLAVGVTRGWRPALTGLVAGTLLLAVLVAIFGPAIQLVPIRSLQLVVGILLLLFGLRWLRKAILRSAGVIGLHDEDAAFAREPGALGVQGVAGNGLDWVGFATSFKATLLEGLEVVFIVVAVGATGGALVPASFGAFVAGLLALAAGFALRKPLSRVPENALKFAVGLLLSSFGMFWVGEGAGYEWPGEDWSIITLCAILLVVSFIAVRLARDNQQKARNLQRNLDPAEV